MNNKLAVLLLVVPQLALALPWSKDMMDQPSVKAQEAVVKEPVGSVPTTRESVVRRPSNLAEIVKFRLEAARELSNPVPAESKSIIRGQAVYETHCQSCHGITGKGDGPVGKKFVPPPMDLTTDYVQQQEDGQIYYTITHGGVVMPFYRDAIGKQDRWHLVNYLKREFRAR